MAAPDDSDARLDIGIATLRQLGERVTTARRCVLAVLASASGHLSAEQINDEVAVRSPGVHRSTVYRTLESLVQAGVVAHVHLPHGAAAYHLQDHNHRPHVHVVCRRCDAVIDSAADLLDGVAAELMRTQGFRLDPDHVALTGWCDACRDTSGPDPHTH